MNRNGYRLWLVVIVVCVPILSACSQNHDMDDLKEFVARTNTAPAIPIETPVPIPAYPSHPYQPGKRPRSPFRFSAQPDIASPTRNHTPGPLEDYPLKALKMVGTITTSNRRYALILAPDDQVHRVTTGVQVDHRRWVITAISNTQVQLSRTSHGGHLDQQPVFLSLQPS